MTIASEQRPFQSEHFCSDADLLRWEPLLFVEASFAAQSILQTQATLDGDRLTLEDDTWFDVVPIEAGHVALLESNNEFGAVPIVEIESPDTAIIRRHPRDGVGAGRFRVTVRTFAGQRRIAGELLRRMAGVAPGANARLVDSKEVRRACALGTLQMIYASLHASAQRDDAEFVIRKQLYTRLYRQAIRALVVEIADTAGHVIARRMLRPVHFPARQSQDLQPGGSPCPLSS